MHEKYKLISEEEWQVIKEQADEIVLSRDTLISGEIVIIRKSNRYWVKETTDKGQNVIHFFADIHSAQRLVDARLKVYEQMWDGCGCKVNYFADS